MVFSYLLQDSSLTPDVLASYSSQQGFYVNGEYCMYGIDSQPVNDEDMFEIVYEEME